MFRQMLRNTILWITAITLLAACGGATSSPTSTSPCPTSGEMTVDMATPQPADVLLELAWEGGLGRPELAYSFGRVPEFSLLPDGSVYYLDPPGWIEPKLMAAHLSPAEAQDLVQRVLDLGFERLESHADYCQPQPDGTCMCVMDASQSILRVRLPGGEVREIRNYHTFANDPEALAAIRTLLQDYQHLEAKVYQPDRAAILIRPVPPPSDLTLPDWPLDPAWLAGAALGSSCARVLSGEDLQALLAVTERNMGDLLFGEGDRVYSIYLAPWLPGVDYADLMASSGQACPPAEALASPCAQTSASPAGSRLIVEEHPLKRPPSIAEEEGPAFEMANGNTADILAANQAYRDAYGLRLTSNNALLQPFGYHLEITQCAGPGRRATFALYQEDELYAEPVFDFYPVSVNASRTDLTMQLDLSDGTYLLTQDGLARRNWGYNPPVYVGDGLLAVEVSDTIRVSLDDELVYQVHRVPSPISDVTLDSPWSYDQHWVMEFVEISQGPTGDEGSGYIVRDGQDLNRTCGYEESFQFALLDGRPFYFFLRQGKIDISYDGQEIPQGYDEIPHYLCCSAGALNPGSSQNMVWFFARRGEQWYYVEAYVPLAEAPTPLCEGG